jgi:Butirosin biosynthesis protein H, N-terminal/Domain of unknown function (DUF4872)
MTKRRDFKSLVRERMDKTGERYTAARAQLLGRLPASPSAPAFPGVLPGYDSFGGIQSGTSALRNTLASLGRVSPLDGTPYTEALVNGLCGGPGFLYAVFEYKGWPPMLSLALRSRSMPDVYIAEGVSRIGAKVKTSETTSPVVARKALEAALADGKAALCVTDAASLPWTGLPQAFVGGGPHVVAVAGRDRDDFWIDDRAAHPRRISDAQLSKARAAYRQAKNRLMTLDGDKPGYDARKAMRDAIADTAMRYVEPAVPKSFWVNCGFSGLDKWRQMLVDPKDKRGWQTVFSDGARACAALQRLHESIECQSAPQAGRGLYAEFLDDAAGALGAPQLARAAAAYREAGVLWTSIGGIVAECDDPAVRKACRVADEYLEGADTGRDSAMSCAERAQDLQKIASDCKLTKTAARAIYADIASAVGRIADAERTAVDLMHAAVKGK